ncbi:MAG: ABC transporter permease [Bacteroidales bacterium]|nr:ABC transporter permease [Bacteroidales bacterium]
MNSKLKHIIKFEFLRMVKTKGFIVGVILVPVMFIGIMAVMAILAENSNDHSEDEISVGIYSATKDSVLAEIVENIEQMQWHIVESDNKEELRKMTFEKKISGFIEYDSVSGYNFYSDNYTDLYVSNTINGIVHSVNRRNEIMRSGLSNEQIDKILNPASVNTLKLSEDNPEEAETSNVREEAFKRQMCGYVFAFLIMMSVMMFGQSIGMSVLEDKTTKIVDVLLTSVSPMQLLTGKILGVGGAGLLQFFVWVLIAIITTTYSGGLPFGSLSEYLTPQLFAIAAVYFVLGFIMVMSIYAAFGSMAETQQHYNQLISGISIFMSVPFIAITPVTMNPESTFSIVMSMIPIFSSSLMPVRIIAGDVPVWQLILSLAILVGSCLLVIKIAARIYRNGIMQQGKEFKFKDIIQLMRK